MEIFLVVTLTTLIAVLITDTSKKRRALLCQRVGFEPQQPTIRE